MKGPGFEIWFKHGLDHAEGNIAGKPTRRRPRKTATAVQLSSGQEGVAAFIAPIESGLSIPYDEFYDMLGWDPRPIIERAWMEVELVARELLLKAEPEPKGLPFEEVALRVGVPPGIVSAFQELRALRSGAVFSAHFMPTEEDVHRYETLAATVRDELKKHVPQA
ncbi:hypothetical protein AZA_49682 [Nitrospirillum viridazoti Y2]|nr:hypothetical protein AZA_49682 [Nitrospirillum amazonense Y2]